MVAAVHLQGHPKTRLYWPTPGYSEQTTFGSHHWSILFKSNNMGVSGFPTNPPPPKKNMSIGMRHVCFSMFFLCGKIFTYIITLFILDLHIDCGKKTRPGTNMSPLFYDVPFPKKRSQGGKGVSC